MSNKSTTFPFDLTDIKGWMIKRKDGILVKYTLVNAEEVMTSADKKNTGTTYTIKRYTTGFSDWCQHTPDPINPPIYERDGIALYIADASGARKAYDKFDVAIDGGGVLSVPGEHDLPYLFGDPYFKKLDRFANKFNYQPKAETKILKVRWFDRAAPPLMPEFWPEALKSLKRLLKETGKDRLTVLTICQGGHGRSGSALASLMMCLDPTYSPLDALTHIRALHCPRAIESKEQHEYLNKVGILLGREPDALDAEHIPSFKERLKSEPQFAEVYKARVLAGQGAKIETREASFL